ncbi:MAG: hypothetical protein ACJ796_06735 [Gemmatimonadaceae bacterium]
MDKLKTKVLQWARRVLGFLGEYAPKSDLAELETLRQELEVVVGELTANAAAQAAITKQSRVQTTEIRRAKENLREAHLKPIVRMSRTLKLEMNGTEITFVLPPSDVDNERLAASGDAMVTALQVLGPQFVARGFAANFVDQLSNATKALRDAIDQRSAQLGRRVGTTEAIVKGGERAVQLVRVIDTLVRPVIQNNAELLATWDNIVALQRSPRSAGVVVATPAVAKSDAGQEGKAAA